MCCRGAPVAQQSMGAKPRRRTNAELDELQHPLLGDQPTLQLMAPKDATSESTPAPPPFQCCLALLTDSVSLAASSLSNLL